jgi:hypothetical protein
VQEKLPSTIRQSLLLAQLVQVKATCPRQGDSCPTCPRQSATCPTCPSQGYMSKATAQVNGHLSKQRLLVQVKAALSEAACQACLSMTACPRQGYLSKSMATYPSQSYSSKSRLLCQKLYVQGMAASPRLLVEAATCQLAQVMAACPSDVNGYLSTAVNGHLPTAINGCFSK